MDRRLPQLPGYRAPLPLIVAMFTGWAAVVGPATAVAQTPQAAFAPAPLGPPHLGPAPPLPDIEPAAAEHPAPAAPPAAPPAAVPLDTAPRFVLLGYKIDGNTVLEEAAVRDIIAPYLNKPVSIADLEEMRRQLTLLYITRGYINSGFTVPDQDVSRGVVVFHATEGRIAELNVAGTDHFSPDYFNARLQRGLTTPFNVNDLQEEQQILLQDPLVRRLDLDVQPGLAPGQAKLQANVAEASPYSLGFQIANNQSPTVGEVRGQVQGGVSNLLGYGDTLAADYGRSQGLNDGAISYSVPIASDDTRLNLRFDINGTLVISPALSPLHITSTYNSYAIGLSRPFYRTPEQTLTLGVNLEKRDAQDFLLGMPFSFTAGSDNGRTNVTALRFFQDWVDRDAEHALALHSTFSFGIDALGATVMPGVAPSGTFFSWLGQGQYVRRVYKNWDLVIRSDLQLADRPLFPIEQFALGGIDTVRGYREYLTVTDDAFFGSGELRIPVGKIALPRIADNDEAGVVQFVPFYDYGRAWNVRRPTPYPPDISSVGGGFRWVVGSGITLEVYYGKALRHVDAGTSLQDRGIHFRLTAAAF
jgi:hemolysin activation/secretion protein